MHDFFKMTSLLDLYKNFVEALLHSDADTMFSRDYDPQLFKMLLGETRATTNVASLTMSDLLLPNKCTRPTNDSGSLSSVRPFLFNMPQHMTENASSCIDDLVLFYERDPGQVLLRYGYKKDYYNRNQLPISPSSGGRRWDRSMESTKWSCRHEQWSKWKPAWLPQKSKKWPYVKTSSRKMKMSLKTWLR